MSESLEDYIKEEAKKILIEEMGIDKGFKGYRYLITSAKIVVNAEQCDIDLNAEEIYSRIAAKHRTSKQKVERDIRYVQELYQNEIKDVFKINNKVSNKRLILLLADRVEENIRKKGVNVFQGTAENVENIGGN